MKWMLVLCIAQWQYFSMVKARLYAYVYLVYHDAGY